MNPFRLLLPLLASALISLATHAVEPDPVHDKDGSPAMQFDQYLLAQGQGGQQGDSPVIAPVPGTLILPEDRTRDNTEKKCMTVCARWGEECTYINRGPAGTTRSCRRTCQQYTQECF